MINANVKKVLQAAGKLPAADARRVVEALAAKQEKKPDMEKLMEDAKANFIGAMTYAMLRRLEEEMPEEEEGAE